jgi:hypothetical protein
MNEVILGAAAAILATNATFGIAFITKINSMFDDNINIRRGLLNKDFLSKINESKNADAKIGSFLPLFKEHEKIESWKNITSQIYENITYSFILTLVGICFGLLNLQSIEQLPIEALLIASGGFMALYVVVQIIGLANVMHKWKQAKEVT